MTDGSIYEVPKFFCSKKGTGHIQEFLEKVNGYIKYGMFTKGKNPSINFFFKGISKKNIISHCSFTVNKKNL